MPVHECEQHTAFGAWSVGFICVYYIVSGRDIAIAYLLANYIFLLVLLFFPPTTSSSSSPVWW